MLPFFRWHRGHVPYPHASIREKCTAERTVDDINLLARVESWLRRLRVRVIGCVRHGNIGVKRVKTRKRRDGPGVDVDCFADWCCIRELTSYLNMNA